MAITEEMRLRLHKRLEEILGTEQAAALIAEMRSSGWTDLATKSDLAPMNAAIAELKADVRDIRRDLVETRHSLEAAIENQGNVLRAEFQHDLRVQLAGMIGGCAALFTLIATAFRII